MGPMAKTPVTKLLGGVKKDFKIPAAVSKAREAVGVGIEELKAMATGEANELMKQKLGTKQINVLAQNMRNQLSPEAKQAYSVLSSDKARREWLLQYMLDPESVTCKGYNVTEAVNSKMLKEKGLWLHLSELGGPKYLNDHQLAKAITEAGELPSRPSEYKSLADQGYEQFWYTKDVLEKATGTRERAGVRADTEMSAEHYTQISDHIRDSLGKPTKKAPPPKAAVALTAEQKAKKEALTTKATTTRKLKALIDKINNELATTRASLGCLTEKGYPASMKEWCEKKLSDFAETVKATNNVYIDAVSTTDSESTSFADILGKTKKIDEVSKTHPRRQPFSKHLIRSKHCSFKLKILKGFQMMPRRLSHLWIPSSPFSRKSRWPR